jgi:hypothetical protein
MTESRDAEQEVTLLRREEKLGEHEKNVHGEVHLIDRGLLMGDPLLFSRSRGGAQLIALWCDEPHLSGGHLPSKIQRTLRFLERDTAHRMGIHHGRFDITMAQQLLNGANIIVGLQ